MSSLSIVEAVKINKYEQMIRLISLRDVQRLVKLQIYLDLPRSYV